MINGVWEKTPTEERSFSAEFSADIPSGDTIKPIGVGSQTDVVITDSVGTDVTVSLLKTKAISSTRVVITFQAGTDGMDYRVIARAEMNSAGTVFDKIYELRVRTARRTL